MHVQMMIVENCGTHNMPGCNECTGESNLCPNTLESLQRVCNAHAMEMCAGYNSMCAVNGNDMEYFCGNRGGQFDPPMRMYFHNGATSILSFPPPPVFYCTGRNSPCVLGSIWLVGFVLVHFLIVHFMLFQYYSAVFR